MTRSLPILLALTAGLLLVSCTGGGGRDWVELEPAAGPENATVRITGTVRHMDLEGGRYVIRDAEGTNYDPANLPESFRVDGLAVEAEARLREDMASIGMVGPIIELIRIRERDGGEAPPGPDGSRGSGESGRNSAPAGGDPLS